MSRYLVLVMCDVMPTNWPACKVLLSALDGVAHVPKSLLVIPNFYRGPTARQSERFCHIMSECLAGGDELVLHGYAHLDDQPPDGLVDQLIRARCTVGGGEFSAIPLATARAHIQTGAAWFVADGWPLHGFVAPAQLMNPATWGALDGLPLRYTITLQRFYLLHPRRPLKAPYLTYSVRSPARRPVSCHHLCWLAQRHAEVPLLRLGLHSVDVVHPDVIRHWQELLAACPETCTPVTRNGFVQVLAQARMGGLETTVIGQAQTSY